MISILSEQYTLTNIFMVCIQLIIPLIIYLISVLYISDAQEKWYNGLSFVSDFSIVSGYKGLFLGSIAFFFTGIASLIILDFYYFKSKGGKQRLDLKQFFTDIYNKDETMPFHFYLFPIMILLTNLGMPIAYQTHSFITHIVFNVFALIINLYLMFYYVRYISYTVSLLLVPLLFWQLFNIIFYSPGVLKSV